MSEGEVVLRGLMTEDEVSEFLRIVEEAGGRVERSGGFVAYSFPVEKGEWVTAAFESYREGRGKVGKEGS